VELRLRIALSDAPSAHATVRSTLAVERAAAHLDAHFSEPIDVPRLAAMVDITQNYFARRFQERFGMTAQRYVLARRIEHARELLRHTDLAINRIASRVGFLDAQHFNKAFRRVTGMSPSKARG
jgi:AraC family transcriptional regulator